MEFLGTATCTLSLLRILLLAAGNNPCPELAQQEQHPLQNQGCAGIHQQQRCPEEEPRSLSPPSHLPFSLLTFLAPLLKQLNSLDFFFFLSPSPFSCVVLAVICLEYLMWNPLREREVFLWALEENSRKEEVVMSTPEYPLGFTTAYV